MPDYNKVILMGRLTRDIELRYTNTNTSIANIGLAVGRKYKTKDGETREETCFIDCEAWGRTGEVMKQYLAKGRPVFIEGRLKLEQWQDKDGTNRQKHRVVVESFQFVDSASDRSGERYEPTPEAAAQSRPVQQQQQRQQQQQSSYNPNGPSGDLYSHPPISEDDIPF